MQHWSHCSKCTHLSSHGLLLGASLPEFQSGLGRATHQIPWQGRHGPNAEGADLALGFGSGGGFGLDAWLFLPSCCACGARSRHVDWLKARPWQWVKLAAEEKPKGCAKCHVSGFGGKSSSIKKKQRGELGVWSWHPVPGPTVFSWLCRAGG